MQIDTYRFDAHDGWTDLDSGWSNEANAFDADDSSYASASKAAAIQATGTTAPADRTDVIVQVLMRWKGTNGYTQVLTTGADAEALGIIYIPSTATLFSDWVVLIAPTGGWTWAKVHALHCHIGANANGAKAYQVDLQVLHTDNPTSINTYRFDAHDGWTDVTPGAWSNEDNFFDSSETTYAIVNPINSILRGNGTTAPDSGTYTIATVRVRLKTYLDSGDTSYVAAYVDGTALGTVSQLNWSGGAQWGGWATLTAPTGGWTWAKVHAMRSDAWSGQNGGVWFYMAQVQVVSELIPTGKGQIFLV